MNQMITLYIVNTNVSSEESLGAKEEREEEKKED